MMDGLQRVDPAALAASYDEHGAAVYGLAQWVTGDAQVAARLTEEVFAALRSVSLSGPVEDLRQSVLTDVHRRAVAWRRQHSPLSQTDATLPFESLAHLDDTERFVVAEAYFCGQTYDAVARSLGVDRSEVARIMQRALRRLASPAADGLTPRP